MRSQIDEKEARFLHGRKIPVKYGMLLAIPCCVAFVGVVLWVYLRVPLLIHPFGVMQRIESSTLCPKTVATLAGTFPVIMLLALFAIAIALLFMVSAIHIEKRYQRIIERLLRVNR